MVLNKQNEIFEIRIYSHPLNFFYPYLIYFHAHGISSPENIPHPGILSPLRNVSPRAYFRDFPVFLGGAPTSVCHFSRSSVRPSIRQSVPHHFSGAVHHLIIISGTHVQNNGIARRFLFFVFFHFFFFFFWNFDFFGC